MAGTPDGGSGARRRLGVALVVGLLVVSAFGGIAAGQDDGADDEPNDTRADATRIESGATVEGETPDDDVDWYAVDVEAGEALRVVSSDSPDQAVTVYGPEGSPVYDVRVSPTDALADGFVAEQSGTYSLRVSSDPAGMTHYYLTVETASPDRFEPNDERSRATSVGANGRAVASLAKGEADWFAVEARAGQRINATLSLRTPNALTGADLRLDLYAPDGTRVGTVPASPPNGARVSTDDETDAYQGWTAVVLHANATETGTYYAQVRGAADRPVGGFSDYALSLRTTDRDDDRPPHRLVITKDVPGLAAGAFSYRFSVDGDLVLGPEADPDSRVDGDTIRGRVGPERGTADFYYSGEITEFEFTGDPKAVKITVDGEPVDPSSLAAGSTTPDQSGGTTTSTDATATASGTFAGGNASTGANESATDGTADGTGTSLGGPGFGVTAAVLALAGVALAVLARLR